jgi:hypothetical protein
MADNTAKFKEKIQEHMQVVCSKGVPLGEVDRIEGDYLKLTKDQEGNHHWIPLAWVTRVEEDVHLDRPGEQAMREWTSTAPRAA